MVISGLEPNDDEDNGEACNVRVWDAKTGEELWAFRHLYSVAVAMSADGNRVVSASWSDGIKVLDNGEEISASPLDGIMLNAVAMSADGNRIVTGDSHPIMRIWDAESGTELYTLDACGGACPRVAMSADGRRIVSGSSSTGAIRSWDTETGAALTVLPGKSGVVDLALSACGRIVISGGGDLISGDGVIRVWDARCRNKLFRVRQKNGCVRAIAASIDGSTIVAGGNDRLVRMWRNNT